MAHKLRYYIMFVDMLWVPVAFVIAYGYHHSAAPQGWAWSCFKLYLPVILAVTLSWAALSWRKQLYGFGGGWHSAAAFSEIVVGLLLLATPLLALAFLAKQQAYSRLVLGYFGILLLFGFFLIRCGASFLVKSRVKAGTRRRVVILGNGRIAEELAATILRHPEMYWELVGFIYPSGSEISQADESRLSSLPTRGVLPLLIQQAIQQIIVVMPPQGNEISKLIGECRSAGLRVAVVPQLYELFISNTRLMELDGLPLLALHDRSPSPFSLAVKRGMDIVLAFILLVLTLPILLPIAAFLYVDKRKAFAAELRCGKDGKPFTMYRLNVDRSRSDLAPHEYAAAQLSLTELPQLWNVLRGDMAMVGPRPESFERVKHYSDWQRKRLQMPAGLTGLAQVNGLREEHSSEEKARFDLQYISRWSIFTDLSLLLQTVWTLVVRLCKPKAAAEQPRAFAGKTVRREVMHADSPQSCAD